MICRLARLARSRRIGSPGGRSRGLEPGSKPLAAALLVAAGFGALVGCGQKGPLVLPDRASPPTVSQPGGPGSGDAAENDDERDRRADDDGR